MTYEEKRPDKKPTVLERVITRCRRAFDAKTPLIMIDTEELELVNEVVFHGDFVKLKKKESLFENRFQPYYDLLGGEPDEYEKCVNLFTEHTKLKAVAESAGDLEKEAAQASIFILHLTKDSWQPKGREPAMVSYLRRYAERYVRCRDNSSPLRCSLVLLYGDVSLLPEDLLPHTVIVDVKYPEKEEIMDIVVTMTEEYGCPLEVKKDRESLVTTLAGFGLMDIRRRMRELIFACDEEGRPLLYNLKEKKQVLLDAKKQVLLQNGGLLELQEEEAGQDGTDTDRPQGEQTGQVKDDKNKLGGMGEYRNWVQRYKARMTRKDVYSREGGIRPPKGVLLCGVPGCGKSEAAKILQQEWGLPMLKMNVDQLMGGYVGDSERNMRKALNQAEVMAPCILWIDELDKGFSGSVRSGQDNSTFKRMFGRFLTWMQENDRACFIFATANDISQLPPEFFRSGRFDELFSVFMPTEKECVEIFKEHMRRAEKLRRKEAKSLGITLESPDLFAPGEFGPYGDETLRHIMALLTADPDNMKFVSGADIQKIVTNALMEIVTDAERDKVPVAPVSTAAWIDAVKRVIKSPTLNTQGGSSANLDSIAACYVRLLRGSFVSASGADQVLLEKKGYRAKWVPEKGHMEAGYDAGDGEPDSDYDRALRRAILERFDRLATVMENRELEKLCT